MPSSISKLNNLQSPRVNAADKAPLQKQLLRLQGTRFPPTHPMPARICWAGALVHGTPRTITPTPGTGSGGAPSPPTNHPQTSASSFPPTKTKGPITWPRGTTLHLSMNPGSTLVPQLGCRSLAFPLTLPLSVHKLATNTFQVVLISCLEGFKGPFGRAYAAAGSWLWQAASPPPPGSRPTATPLPTRVPPGGTCPTQRVHLLLLTALAGQEGRFRVPKVGGARCGRIAGILFCIGGGGGGGPAPHSQPAPRPFRPQCAFGIGGVSDGAVKDGMSFSAAP